MNPKHNSTLINPTLGNAATEINSSLRSDTEVNPHLVSKDTAINGEVNAHGGSYTVVNPSVKNYAVELPSGTVLADKYVVDTPLSTNTGEANLYLCTYRKHSYVAKVYRRQGAIKEDVIKALETVDSPNIAKLYCTGLWNGSPFEIIPFYKYGSLEGKTFSYEQLKQSIIPALNEGLHKLHSKGIIHKDLKPSNIMMCDDQKNVAIIDFGISSIREDGSTVVVTKTGMTPEYSAPETFRNLFLEESDYYSLGITIYELFAGHTPYAGADRDTIEQYIAIQKIPFPKDFPKDLESLINGLTFNDITNRKDKTNPNRRWTYDEVKRWCQGEKIIIPEKQNAPEIIPSEKIPPLRFQYHVYTNLAQLTEALGTEWKQGKKRLYRSLLTQYFTPFDQELASYCMDAEDAVKKDNSLEDTEFFTLLYRLMPTMESFHWKDYHYPDMKTLGDSIMEGMRNQTSSIMTMVDEFLTNHLFSKREQLVHRENTDRIHNIEAIESIYILAKNKADDYAQWQQMYLIGYLYSGSKQLIIPQGTFESIDALIQYVSDIIKKDPDQVDALSKELMRNYSNHPEASPQFAAWLIVLGHGDCLKY